MTVSVPVAVDHRVAQRALAASLFTGAEATLPLLADRSGCNSVTLSKPMLDDGEDGLLRVSTTVVARIATPLGKRCLLPIVWHGRLDLLERIAVAADGESLSFSITDSKLLNADGERRGVPGLVWDWVKRYAHPRFESFTFDLTPLMRPARDLVSAALADAANAAAVATGSLRLEDPRSHAQRMTVNLAFEIPPAEITAARDAAPLDAAELEAWDQAWQAWDAFATWTIKTLNATAPAELQAGLLETLLEARYELRAALVEHDTGADPVRRLFVDTWTRLVPLLQQMQLAGRDRETLAYIAFIGAGDALKALDTIMPRFGFSIDADSLRNLARTLSPQVTPDDLRYSTEVDPALREAFGFPAELENELEIELEIEDRTSPGSWLDWLITPSQAAAFDQQRLNEWVPGRKDLDTYLTVMDALLGAIAHHEKARGKIPAAFASVYPPLLRATAWQETCWRQFVKQKDRIEVIRSPAGSVGLMQINTHVWRGVYDLNLLETDVGYNASAGNEILTHYLVDYAIRKKEHEESAGIDGLARATYAAYNGGPAQLKRYRETPPRRSTRAIDEAFWKKYQTMVTTGASAVRQCYSS